MSGTVPKPTILYRFTHIDNIEWMLSNGVPSINSSKKCPNYKGIGDKSIINKRALKSTSLFPGDNLNDYVPFYFAPSSPMLYLLTKNGKAFPQDIVYIVTSVEKLEELNQCIVFTDGHALMAFTKFYTDTNNLNALDWDIMKEKFWRNTLEDNDRQRRREAELLVKDEVLPHAILGLGVHNTKNEEYLKSLVIKSGQNIHVVRRPKWYY